LEYVDAKMNKYFKELDEEISPLFVELETFILHDTYPGVMRSLWKEEIIQKIKNLENAKKTMIERRDKITKLMTKIRVL